MLINSVLVMSVVHVSRVGSQFGRRVFSGCFDLVYAEPWRTMRDYNLSGIKLNHEGLVPPIKLYNDAIAEIVGKQALYITRRICRGRGTITSSVHLSCGSARNNAAFPFNRASALGDESLLKASSWPS